MIISDSGHIKNALLFAFIFWAVAFVFYMKEGRAVLTWRPYLVINTVDHGLGVNRSTHYYFGIPIWFVVNKLPTE